MTNIKKLPDRSVVKAIVPDTPEETRYDSVSDAVMRLSKTFVFFEDTPVYVEEPSQGSYLNMYTSIDKSVCIHMNDVRLNISSPALGWINGNAGPVYPSRNPSRQQQQGFNPVESNCFRTPVVKRKIVDFRPFRIDGDLNINNICAMLEDDYPPISLCAEADVGGAFSREWAIVRPSKKTKLFVLYHEIFPVGYFDSNLRQFSLIEGFRTKTRIRSLNDYIRRSPNESKEYTVSEISKA